MSIKTVVKSAKRKTNLSESELQEKYKKSRNETIQAMLAARREHLERNGRFLTDKEINKELKR